MLRGGADRHGAGVGPSSTTPRPRPRLARAPFSMDDSAIRTAPILCLDLGIDKSSYDSLQAGLTHLSRLLRAGLAGLAPGGFTPKRGNIPPVRARAPRQTGRQTQ